jgi:hypothetical protein
VLGIAHGLRAGRLLGRAPAPAANATSLIAAAAIVWLMAGARARGQDMEPRAYSATPLGTNFLGAGFTDTNGSVSLDPSLPIKGLEASIQTYTLGYDRSFDLFGRSASAAILVPDVQGNLSGEVLGTGKTAQRAGLGDVKMRVAVNLLGGPALTREEFAQRQPNTTLGASLTVIAPTGQYDPARLINIGNNRWALKPEIGLSRPLGKWFAEAYVGAWVYTNDTDFYNGHLRGQAPIYAAQLHGGYSFRPNLWLAADATGYLGGRTSLGDIGNNDTQSVVRYGLTLSIPLPHAFSLKANWSSWLASRNGGKYQIFGLTLQYLWFDR